MNKILRFDLSAEQVSFKKILNADFVHLQVDAISDIYPNLNESAFTKDSLEAAKDTCYSKPVLGLFKEGFLDSDFQGHEGDIRIDKELLQAYWDNKEIPLGVVRESDKVEVIEKEGLHWLSIDCVLWTHYNYKAIKNVLKSKKKKVSVEIEVIESEMQDFEGRSVELIKKFNLLGITILGDKYTEAIPGANLKVLEFLEDKLYSKKLACLQFAYKELEENSKEREQKKMAIQSPLLLVAPVEDSDILSSEKGGRGLLTLGQKRDILNNWLNEHVSELPHIEDSEDCCRYAWVVDIDDEFCYYETDRGMYKATYSIESSEDAEDSINIDIEAAVRVVRSWQEYSENPVIDTTVISLGTTTMGDAATSVGITTATNFSTTDGVATYAAPTTFGITGTSITGMTEIGNTTIATPSDGTLANGSEAIAPETISMEAYSELEAKYNTAMAELEVYHEAEAKARRDSLMNFGFGVVDAETMLDANDQECIDSLKENIRMNCEGCKLTTEDEVKNFTEDLLAKAVYQKIKNGKSIAFEAPKADDEDDEDDDDGEDGEGDEGNIEHEDCGEPNKEFSAQIIPETAKKTKTSPFERLKDFNAQH